MRFRVSDRPARRGVRYIFHSDIVPQGNRRAKSEQFGRLVRAGDERWDVPLEIRLIRLSDARSDDILNLWKQLET